MKSVLTIQVQDEVDDHAARVLEALGDCGKLPRFMDAIVERRGMWTVLCWLEEDLLQFAGKNRWCAALDDWTFVVGTSPYLLEDVPSYTGYGDVQAWLEYGDEWVLTIIPAEIRQCEETADVLVWNRQDFYEQNLAIPYARAAFADDSAIHLNRAMRGIDDMEAALDPAMFETYLGDQTQRYLDMSASEFRENAQAGTLPDTPMAVHLLVLAGLL